jgi:hypothetical protein
MRRTQQVAGSSFVSVAHAVDSAGGEVHTHPTMATDEGPDRRATTAAHRRAGDDDPARRQLATLRRRRARPARATRVS